jgi:hypothetical protein
MSAEIVLNDTEAKARDSFFERLKPADRKVVKRVIDSIDTVATAYFTPRLNVVLMRDTSEAEDNSHHFTRQNNWDKEPETGYPFYAVYGIGGVLTKEGTRKDTDLMVATNAWWSSGPIYEVDYPILYQLQEDMGEEFMVEVTSDIPDGYNLAETNGKGMIRLTPIDGKTAPVDIVIARGIRNSEATTTQDSDKYKFLTVEEFEERDVDPKTGESLPRALIHLVK